MQPPAQIFREYDIRGVVGRDLDADAAGMIARAFGVYLRRAGVRRAVIGHDNRVSSVELYTAATRGLTAAGCDVIGIGLAITPMLYFAVHHFEVPGGMMVTASHNPPEFNGFKLCLGPGTLFGAQIQDVRMLTQAATEAATPGTTEDRAVFPAYRQALVERIRLGPKRLRVALDCGNGTAGAFAPEIFRAWGCDVLPLYCDLDPSFPHHHPDPVAPENLTDLIRLVRDSGADVGIGLDGDGDRIGVVDAGGASRRLGARGSEVLPGPDRRDSPSRRAPGVHAHGTLADKSPHARDRSRVRGRDVGTHVFRGRVLRLR